MTKPLYFYNGTTFELVGPTTPQSPIAYQTSAPTAPATGDLWIDSDGDVDTYNRQLTRYYFVATAAQTTITGIDANGLTLAYVAGSEAVYVNGALQVRGQDYTATNGTSVVMSSALAVSDVVEIFAYTAFTVANAYTKSETDSVAAAAAGMRLVVPTSVSVGSGSGSVGSSGTVTFSGATSVSLNGCFTSTYEIYKIVFDLTNGDGSVTLKLRASGTDTTANYDAFTIYGTSGAGFQSVQNALGTDEFYLFNMTTAIDGSGTGFVDIFNPNVAYQTSIVTDALGASGGVLYWYKNYGRQNSTTQFDGFTFADNGTGMTGTVSVYGYKK